VKCYEGRWQIFALLNIFFILVYPIGIPVLFFSILYRNRAVLQSAAFRVKYSFLYDAYTGKLWMFEMADMANKLFMTSILAFFPSTAQVQVALVWNTMFTMVLLLIQPYLRKGDDRLHQIAQIEIYALILMAYTLTHPLQPFDPTTDALLSAILILITLCFLIYFIVQATLGIRKLLNEYAKKRMTTLDDRVDDQEKQREAKLMSKAMVGKNREDYSHGSQGSQHSQHSEEQPVAEIEPAQGEQAVDAMLDTDASSHVAPRPPDEPAPEETSDM